MAVVQISRIQHRRGRKLTNTGMPQLASGELGWAIDTQELYIGNGSVSEGAPYVGNTKVLTEHDNIFTLADQYTYKPQSNIWGSQLPVSRSLQERLDDFVSIASFGATGDGTDQTTAFENAINNLYKSADETNRVVLWLPPGDYLITRTIELPPFVTLRGSGKGKTRIIASNCSAFRTIHYNPTNISEPITNLNQARYIEISSMTIDVSSSLYSAITLASCKNSLFKDLRFEGVWDFGETKNNHSAIILTATATDITSSNNTFDNIEIDSFNFGVYSDDDVRHNTFTSINFYKLKKAVAFGLNSVIGTNNQMTGPLFNTFEKCVFDRVDQEGIHVKNGEYNVSRENKYLNVGNNSASMPIPFYANILFDTNTNISDADYFERTAAFSPNESGNPLVLNFDVKYVPEVFGRTDLRLPYSNEITIGYMPGKIPSGDPEEVLKFPVINSGTIFIDYVYTETNNNIVREGVIELVCNLANNNVTINDEYTYVGNSLYSTALTFYAELTMLGAGPTNDTVRVNAINTIPSANDKFFYTIRVKS
jgi:hypothetical protein